MRSVRVAQNLMKLGYVDGDIIGLIATNNHNIAPIIFGALSIGCIVNPLNPEWDESMFGITKPKLIICDLDNISPIKKCLNAHSLKSKIFTFNGRSDFSQSVADLIAPTNIESDFMCVIS